MNRVAAALLLLASTAAAEPAAVVLDYRLYRVPDGGAAQAVDPAKTVFRGGDRIFLEFGANLSGRFDVFNRPTAGALAKLGSWPVQAGRVARLPLGRGLITFQGEPGDEMLVLQFHMCAHEDTSQRRHCDSVSSHQVHDGRARGIRPPKKKPDQVETPLPDADDPQAIVIEIPLTHR